LAATGAGGGLSSFLQAKKNKLINKTNKTLTHQFFPGNTCGIPVSAIDFIKFKD
jgi:hypothetical protein